MVSTRSATNSFNTSSPERTLSPTKPVKTSEKKRVAIRDVASPTSSRVWSHTPTSLIKIYLAISLPFCTWDILYVLLRPHSMPGGKYHWPLWVPYELYGRVDYVYGWKAWDEHNGFTAGQTWMNVVETALYICYLTIVFRFGQQSAGTRTLYGQKAGCAALIGYSAAIMTFSKTALYCE